MEFMFCLFIFMLFGLVGVIILSQQDFDEFEEDCWKEEEAESVRRSMYLMDLDERKEVYFDKYCSHCEYKDLKEYKDPCHECLSNPVNLYSHKPVKFKSKLDDDYTWPEDVK